jgi:TRAP transporter TAXI family solute receptor
MRLRRTGGVRLCLLTALIAVAVIACSATSGAPSASGTLVISTGSPRGVYYAWAQNVATQLRAANPQLAVTVETSSGSVRNLQRLTDGTADLALTTVDATEQRAQGKADVGAATVGAADAADAGSVPLRALARIYDDYLHIVVRADSSLRSVKDLAGRPVAVGAPDSGTALVARRILDAAGISVSERDIDVVAGTAALEEGTVDAVFWSGGIPTRAINEAAERIALLLLPLDDLADTLRARYGAAYRPATIPPGRYGSTDAVATLASANLLVARADADPAMVSVVLSTIFRRRDAIAAAVPAANGMDRRTAIWTGGMSLHPAAIEYYRRTKP